MKKNFLEIFRNKKPIFAMLHLKGDNSQEIYERAIVEIEKYINGGADAIIVENYYGNYYDMERVLTYLQSSEINIPYGVNCLNMDAMGFDLAKRFNASFVQLDSVAGHLKPRDDFSFEAFMNKYRSDFNGYVIGGVRFKYQPYLSQRTVEQDLIIGMSRCDAIVVTQDKTGEETSLDKIIEFRNIIGNFPLVIGAGLTPENCEKQFDYADASIVGSYFKDTYVDTGDVDIKHVETMIDAVRKIREK